MKASQLNRILGLIRKSSEKLLVADSESDDVFVLMKLNDYEHLLANTTDKSEDESEYNEVGANLSDFNEMISDFESSSYKFPGTKNAENPMFSRDKTIETSVSPNFLEASQKLNFEEDMEWLHDENTRESEAEEDLNDLEEEEEKFYLEPVEP
jgi:hypothetical protein